MNKEEKQMVVADLNEINRLRHNQERIFDHLIDFRDFFHRGQLDLASAVAERILNECVGKELDQRFRESEGQ
jgi:hypothetical protein